MKEVGFGWINGDVKIVVLDGGRCEVVLNSCFEGLGGRVGLKRVWEFVPEVRKKEE